MLWPNDAVAQWLGGWVVGLDAVVAIGLAAMGLAELRVR